MGDGDTGADGDTDSGTEEVWTGEIQTAETLAVAFDETGAVDHGTERDEPTGRHEIVDAAAPLPGDAHPTEVLLRADPTPVGGIRIPRGRRWRRRVLLGVLVVFVASAAYYGITLFQVHSTGQSDQARPVDALVVMGAAQYDGTPSPQLQARLDHALELWNADTAARIVVTGGKLPTDRFTEAEASANYLVEHGVPPPAILAEDRSHNSYDALVGVADLLPDGARVLIVTDPYHSLRSRLTAEEIGLVAYVSPTRTSPVQGGSARSREIKEAFGVALGRIIGFRRLLDLTG